jgi:TolB-like protein
MSADKDNEYFSDGISEELLNVLVRVDGIGVASRTSSFAYKGRELGAAKIAAELKVDHILEGSVRKSGNRVRITAQLIDAVNDRHLWSETFDRELTDIFAIQDEIANAIVAALRGELGGSADGSPAVLVKADTGDLQAYELYLKARELFIARRDIGEGIRLAERAVELDPTFARGWEVLAALAVVAEDWGVRDRDYTELAVVAAQRALDLDPALSMPWAVRALGESTTLPIDWDRYLASVGRAIAADPRNETAFQWRAMAWMNLGWFDRAVADLDQCLVLDPAYPNCTRFKALALLHKGDTEHALELFQQGVAVGFVRNRADSFVLPLWERGERLAALLLVDASNVPVGLRKPLLESLVGERPADAATVAEVVRRDADPLDALSQLGTTALLWSREFDRAAESPGLDNSSLAHWERIPGLRNSPGFKRMLERLGVATHWRKHGFPPQCRPLGDTGFECDAAP